MWTGNVQGGYPTQWALNPSAYQNVPNEQVDWATLAQQWIQMKETFPVDQIPPAPPPPSISSIKTDIEAGEAPMDISKDDVANTTPTTSQDGSNWGGWNNWQQQWNWGWGGSGGNSSSTSVPPDKVPTYPYTAPPATTTFPADTPTTFDYNHGSAVPDSFEQNCWPGGQAPYVRGKSSEWREPRESSGRSRQPSKVEEVAEPDTTMLFDAAKRKQLPAWIREGLEKMEREKQKKLERERQLKEREEEMLRRKKEEEEALAAGIPVKSKFETDSEESEKETEELPVKNRRSRFDASSPVPSKPVSVKCRSPPSPVKRKTTEEIVQDVMLQVKYTLTNVLMTVTNEEMQKVAEEVLADFRAKAPATQLRKTPALTSLTGKLGLGIYDSDSEESSAESEPEKSSIQDNGVDSDQELRDRIRRKRQEFARIERDIENEVELQEERDREREQATQEEDEELLEEKMDKGQVEPKLIFTGSKTDIKTEEVRNTVEIKQEHTSKEFYTPERPRQSSDERSEDSDRSWSKSESTSRSSSSSRHKKSRKSSKKRKEKKVSKRKRKRSSSRGSDRRRSSHKKSSHRYERSHSRSRSRSRSRSHDDHRYRRSPSYHRRHHRHRSYSHSPDYSRGKRSSHRSRD